MTGTVGSREACIAPASTKSFMVAMARSGMPRRDAVVAAPLHGRRSVGTRRFNHRRHIPLVKTCEASLKCAPSADTVTDARCNLNDRSQAETLSEGRSGAYNDTRAGEHLAQASSRVQRQGTFKVVLRVQARVVVDTSARRIPVRLGCWGGRADLNHGGGLGSGVGGTEEFEAWHVERVW